MRIRMCGTSTSGLVISFILHFFFIISSQFSSSFQCTTLWNVLRFVVCCAHGGRSNSLNALAKHVYVHSCSIHTRGIGRTMAGALAAESCVRHMVAVDLQAAHPSFMFFSHHHLMKWNFGEGCSLCKIGNLCDSGKVIGVIGGVLVLCSLGSFGHLWIVM